jgi:hypothetical protein
LASTTALTDGRFVVLKILTGHHHSVLLIRLSSIGASPFVAHILILRLYLSLVHALSLNNNTNCLRFQPFRIKLPFQAMIRFDRRSTFEADDHIF